MLFIIIFLSDISENPAALQSLQKANVIQHGSKSTRNLSENTSANLIARKGHELYRNSSSIRQLVNCENEELRVRSSISQEQTTSNSAAHCTVSQSKAQTKSPAVLNMSSSCQLPNNAGIFSNYEVEDNEASADIGTQTCQEDPSDHVNVSSEKKKSAGVFSLSKSVNSAGNTSIITLTSKQPSFHSIQVEGHGLLSKNSSGVKNTDSSTMDIGDTTGDQLIEARPQTRKNMHWIAMPSSALNVPHLSSPETTKPQEQAKPPKDSKTDYVTLTSSDQPGIAFKAIPLSSLKRGMYVRFLISSHIASIVS